MDDLLLQRAPPSRRHLIHEKQPSLAFLMVQSLVNPILLSQNQVKQNRLKDHKHGWHYTKLCENH